MSTGRPSVFPDPPKHHQTVVRIWKRDGTKNVMEINIAVANLQFRAKSCQGLSTRAIRARLLLGETIHTPLAMYKSLARLNGE